MPSQAAPAVSESLSLPSRFYLLGSRVDRLTLGETLLRIRAAVSTGRPHHVVTTNTLMLLAAETDDALRAILENVFLSVPESWGVRWASRHYRAPLFEMIPGIDLMASLCGLAEIDGLPIYLLGGRAGVADDAARGLLKQFPRLKIVGVHHGYFQEDDAAIQESLHSARPALLFVGMGMPQQEKWIAKHLAALNVPVVMGVGGSFDVWSGRLARAPHWMRRLGIEWMYRLAQEPWRWRRILQLPVFMWKVLREAY